MLKPSLQLRIGQQLTMTPQLQQAIRLLQLPALDLQAHVRETLETNVMLEADDDLGTDIVPETLREPDDRPAREEYAELDGKSTDIDQREQPEVEIADEAWGEQTTGPSILVMVRRRRPQRRFQRPARADPARTARRTAGTRETVADRPRDRARDRRFDIRGRLSAG